jgi:HTH-type transcriptional regulator / antitoxin HigA
MNTQPILEQWRVLDTLAHDYLGPIHSPEQNERALELLGEIWDQVGEDPTHPLASLFDLLVARVTAFEATAYPIPESSPERIMGFLMRQHDYTQTHLSELTGIDQGNISKILKSERNLTLEQIRVLSRVFNVNVAVFL